MERKDSFCGWCCLLIFPFEERISVKDRDKDYHPSCFDKQVKKEVETKGGRREVMPLLRKNT